MNSGIYMIKNEETNKVYIGSTANFKTRFYEHRRSLRGNKHHSAYLQNSWNKRGNKAFRFYKLEYIEDSIERFKREQWWMELFQSYNSDYGYNMVKVSELGGAVHQELTKKKISISRKRWHKENPEKSNSKRVKVVNFRTSPFTWKDFSSITEALEYHKINKNHISSYTNKRTFKDLAFVTLDSPNAYNRLKKIYIRWLKNNNETYYTKAEPIYALNLITNQIEVFPSQNQFRKKTGRNLNPVILNNAHKVGNYRPAYKREYLERWM